MATSYVTDADNGPKLVPEVKGNKVVFTRKTEEADAKAAEPKSEPEPQSPDQNTTDAPPEKPARERRGQQ